jgi:hypothetical protein
MAVNITAMLGNSCNIHTRNNRTVGRGVLCAVRRTAAWSKNEEWFFRSPWEDVIAGWFGESWGTSPCNLGESEIRCSKIGPWVARDSDPRKTVLARPSSNWKLQTRPGVREGAPHQQTRNFLQIIKKFVMGPRWEPDIKIDWTTDRRS